MPLKSWALHGLSVKPLVSFKYFSSCPPKPLHPFHILCQGIPRCFSPSTWRATILYLLWISICVWWPKVLLLTETGVSLPIHYAIVMHGLVHHCFPKFSCVLMYWVVTCLEAFSCFWTLSSLFHEACPLLMYAVWNKESNLHMGFKAWEHHRGTQLHCNLSLSYFLLYSY